MCVLVRVYAILLGTRFALARVDCTYACAHVCRGARVHCCTGTMYVCTCVCVYALEVDVCVRVSLRSFVKCVRECLRAVWHVPGYLRACERVCARVHLYGRVSACVMCVLASS
jgi:hypothetical protein